MNDPLDTETRRILIVDDNEAIHEDFRKILADEMPNAELDATAAAILGRSSEALELPRRSLEIHSAFQGEDGIDAIARSLEHGQRFALAFVDMRMPPGCDGLETIARAFELDEDLQVVLCTAYSDYSWEELTARLGISDRLLILKKPFDPVEARQLAIALTEKWSVGRIADRRFTDLQESNSRLQSEVIQRQRAEAKLLHRALYDSLTELPNRALVLDRINDAIRRAKQDPSYHYGVLFIDLDNFKVVNDSLGHKVGDVLLVEIGRRLDAALRQFDAIASPADHLAGRLGGDEFVILVDGIRCEQDLMSIADRIQSVLAEPFELRGNTLSPSASIGVTWCAAEYDLPEEVLRDSDIALYRAKEAGRRCAVRFDKDMREAAMKRLEEEGELRSAIENKQFLLHYQPIVGLESGRIIGLEALARWLHPEHGLIGPNEFIPLAEQTGLIVPLGRFILEEACRQTQAWRSEFPGCREMTISVNFSARQLAVTNFVEELQDVLADTGLDPEGLHLELTESLLMEQSEQNSRTLDALQRARLSMHMDDFGTGYSSLSYLHRLPISTMKIDRSFVSSMLTSKEHAATIEAIISLARIRDLRVIAEGIETAAQVERLRELGADLGQGFFFSKPLDAARVSRILEFGLTQLTPA